MGFREMLTGRKPKEAVERYELIRCRRRQLTVDGLLKLAERNRQHSDGWKPKALDRTMKQMEGSRRVPGERGRAEVFRCNRLSALALDYRFRRGNARNATATRLARTMRNTRAEAVGTE